MKTASFVGVILPQTPVHLVQILYSILQWVDFNPGTLTFNPNSMKISNWTTNVANQMKNNLDWPGFTRFVAKIYQSQITHFLGKILNSNFCLCKKFDISQLCLPLLRRVEFPSGICTLLINLSSQGNCLHECWMSSEDFKCNMYVFDTGWFF